MKIKFKHCFFTICLIFTSCIMPTSNVSISPSANLKSIKSVAIWRFRDGGKIQNSGDIATRAIESAFMQAGYRIISYSKIRDIVAIEIGFREGMALEAGMLTPNVLKRIRNETGCDAIIIGSVSNSFIDPMWTPSSWIECSFQMIETESGEVIISANLSDDGWSIQRAAQQMAKKAIKQIR